MSKESVFEKMGTGFSTLKIFSGDTIPSRPAKIVRFEIPRDVFTVNLKLHF